MTNEQNANQIAVLLTLAAIVKALPAETAAIVIANIHAYKLSLPEMDIDDPIKRLASERLDGFVNEFSGQPD